MSKKRSKKTGLVFWATFKIGFIFGYVLYYAGHHTKELGIGMLSVAFEKLANGGILSKTVLGAPRE